MNKDPQFIVIGAHKCGTSWLFNCLYEHPEILIKEKIDYFFVAKKLDYGNEWYQSHFKDKRGSLMVKGELSTVYLFSEESAKEIYNFNPEIKLIVMLRNPIERTYSHYLQDIKMGEISKETSFESAISGNPRMLEWGHYKKHLEGYEKYFSEEQLLIILFDDITKNPKGLIQKVYTFLDIDQYFTPQSLAKKINPSRIPKNIKLDFKVRRISQFLKQNPLGERIWWFLKHSWFTKKYYSLNESKATSIQGIDIKTRAELNDYFHDDINYIQKKLKRNDIKWN